MARRPGTGVGASRAETLRQRTWGPPSRSRTRRGTLDTLVDAGSWSELAFATSVGILIDALVVRSLLVPALTGSSPRKVGEMSAPKTRIAASFSSSVTSSPNSANATPTWGASVAIVMPAVNAARNGWRA